MFVGRGSDVCGPLQIVGQIDGLGLNLINDFVAMFVKFKVLTALRLHPQIQGGDSVDNLLPRFSISRLGH